MILDLSFSKNIEAKFRSKLDQLYHPTGFYKIDSYDVVYSFNTIDQTKFAPILLKEWFFLTKKNGLLVVDYKQNKLINKKKLEEYMDLLWKNKFVVIYHGAVSELDIKNLDDRKIEEFIGSRRSEGEFTRFICKKIISTTVKEDEITKWTFGIITNGKRNDWVAQIIESIRQQKIPSYEIIICGTYSGKTQKDTAYLPFNIKDDKGWITKKKNLIVKKAKFENICVLHDRMVLDIDWYKGMKEWGNCFENLGCRQFFNQERVNDWLTSHFFINSKEGERFSFESYVDYRDWYPTIWFLGQLNIFKKSIITKNKLWWNEDLYYGQREDYDFSSNLSKQGFIHRFNDLSTVKTLTNKYINPTYIEYNPYSLNPVMKLNNAQAFFKLGAYLFFKSLNSLGINLSFKALENIRGKIYTFILMFNPTKYSHNREWKRVIK